MSRCIYIYLGNMSRCIYIYPGYNICPAAFIYPLDIVLYPGDMYIYAAGPGCFLSRDRHVMAAHAARAYCNPRTWHSLFAFCARGFSSASASVLNGSPICPIFVG